MNDANNVNPPCKPDISEEMLSRWQTIVDLLARIVGVPAELIMKDEGGRNIFGNKTLLKSFSKKLEEFIGTTSHDFFPQDIAKRLETYDQTVRTQCIEIELHELSEICDDEIRWWKDANFSFSYILAKHWWEESRSTSLLVSRRKKP